MSFFASWLINPWMLGLGALAVASPLIIHLLNRRRFKIVDWAAMDFLFDADKKNRRRVRLENLILLLLRCLAMLLIGLLLARPFLPSSLARVFTKAQQFELVVLLDDSFSQQVQAGSESLFDQCRDALQGLVTRAANSAAEETLTLYLTSQPERPLISNKPLQPDTVSEVVLMLDDLRCSDGSANLWDSLQEIEGYVASQREDVNRVVYVFSDLRARDWQAGRGAETPASVLKKIADHDSVAGCFVIDNPSMLDANLAITGVETQDLLVADTLLRFSVTVSNWGTSLVRDIPVRFQVDDDPPQTETIPQIDPGKSAVLTFAYTFRPPPGAADQDLAEKLEFNLANHRIRAEIVADARPLDVLPVDSQYDYVARTRAGIPVLLVDGEPNVLPERSETHFLASIEVAGTGIIADTVTHTEFESVSLSRYEVIFLCNVGELSQDRLQALQQWVRDGGGLVLMPGGQVRAAGFNETFYQEGRGLSPFALVAEQGDVNRQNYVGFSLQPGGHPGLAVATALDNIFSSLKIYRWWSTTVAENAKDPITIPLRLTDASRSIAMAERLYGAGRVIAFTFPADLDWTDWPPHPSFAPVFFDLAHTLAARDRNRATMLVDGNWKYPVDLSRFETQVTLVDPAGESREANAAPVDASATSAENVLYQVSFEHLARRGLYQMRLQRPGGVPQRIDFAVNLDPSESDLRRLDLAALGSDYFGPRTKVLSLGALESQVVTGGHNEIWPQILITLACVLGVEQFLAWWFGRRR